MNFHTDHPHSIVTADSEMESPSLRILSALYRHGSKTALWNGNTLVSFGEKEWSAARRETRLGRRHKKAFLVMNQRGVPLRTGYHHAPWLLLYLERATGFAESATEA